MRRMAVSLRRVERSSRRSSVLGLHRAREHQRVVAVGHLHALDAEAEARTHVVEGDAAAIELQVLQGAAHGGAHVEGVAAARALDPGDIGAAGRNKAVDVAARCRQVERHHHGAERADVLHPRRLLQEGPQVVVRDHQDRPIRRVARQDERVGARLVGLVGDGVEAGEIEHVVGQRGDDAVEAARLEREQQAVEIAEALGQGHAGERARRLRAARLPP